MADQRRAIVARSERAQARDVALDVSDGGAALRVEADQTPRSLREDSSSARAGSPSRPARPASW